MKPENGRQFIPGFAFRKGGGMTVTIDKSEAARRSVEHRWRESRIVHIVDRILYVAERGHLDDTARQRIQAALDEAGERMATRDDTAA
jgi:hypothetical protein